MSKKMAEAAKKTKTKTTQKKRPTKTNSDSSSEDDELGGMDLTGKPNPENFDVLFEFRDPHPSYYNAISSLLNRFPCTEGIDTINLSEEIAGKPEIGTLVCQEEGSDVFGFITAMNLGSHRSIHCLNHLKSFIQEKCPSDKIGRLNDVLSDPSLGVGFFIKSQMVNFPPQLVPAMHRSLCTDISWAYENAENDEEEKTAKFDYFIFVAQYSDMTEPPSDRNNNKKQKKTIEHVSTSRIFDHFDEEIMAQSVEWSFEFQQQSKHFFVGLISLKQYEDSIAQMEKMFS